MQTIEADTIIKVPFYDIDMMSMAWHGHYAKYFETARNELFDRIGYNHAEMLESGYVWPIIDMRIQYVKPIQFGMNIRVRARLAEYENRLKVDYLITDAGSGLKLTKGYTSQVAVDMKSGEMRLRSPDVVFEKLGLSPE